MNKKNLCLRLFARILLLTHRRACHCVHLWGYENPTSPAWHVFSCLCLCLTHRPSCLPLHMKRHKVLFFKSHFLSWSWLQLRSTTYPCVSMRSRLSVTEVLLLLWKKLLAHSLFTGNPADVVGDDAASRSPSFSLCNPGSQSPWCAKCKSINLLTYQLIMAFVDGPSRTASPRDSS